jgi:hypothetical protein
MRSVEFSFGNQTGWKRKRKKQNTRNFIHASVEAFIFLSAVFVAENVSTYL